MITATLAYKEILGNLKTNLQFLNTLSDINETLRGEKRGVAELLFYEVF